MLGVMHEVALSQEWGTFFKTLIDDELYEAAMLTSVSRKYLGIL